MAWIKTAFGLDLMMNADAKAPGESAMQIVFIIGETIGLPPIRILVGVTRGEMEDTPLRTLATAKAMAALDYMEEALVLHDRKLNAGGRGYARWMIQMATLAGVTTAATALDIVEKKV